jgi:hypothetical protein
MGPAHQQYLRGMGNGSRPCAAPSLQVAVVSFGVRNKIKPFSSLLIYTEQETTTPYRPRLIL